MDNYVISIIKYKQVYNTCLLRHILIRSKKEEHHRITFNTYYILIRSQNNKRYKKHTITYYKSLKLNILRKNNKQF